MREIKFDIILWDGEDPKTITHFDPEDALEEDLIAFKDGAMIPRVLVVIIRQYTGIKDKNGNEIYEGDIVDWRGQYSENAPQPIIWCHTGWYVGYKNKKHMNITSLNCIEKVVRVGNIYETPEPLEVK